MNELDKYLMCESIDPTLWNEYTDAYGTEDIRGDEDEDETGADEIPVRAGDRYDEFRMVANRINDIMGVDEENADDLLVSDLSYGGAEEECISQASQFASHFVNISEQVDIDDSKKVIKIPAGPNQRGYTVYFYLYECDGRKFLLVKVADAMEYFRIVIRKDDLEFFQNKEFSSSPESTIDHYDDERAEIEKGIHDTESMMGHEQRNR